MKIHRIGIFLLTLLGATIVATIVWDTLLVGRLYYCTDEIGLGYLSPGDWVHGDVLHTKDVAGLARATASSDNPMGHRDLLDEHWSHQGLWAIWFLFAFLSVLFSLVVASSQWIQRFLKDRFLASHSNKLSPE